LIPVDPGVGADPAEPFPADLHLARTSSVAARRIPSTRNPFCRHSRASGNDAIDISHGCGNNVIPAQTGMMPSRESWLRQQRHSRASGNDAIDIGRINRGGGDSAIPAPTGGSGA